MVLVVAVGSCSDNSSSSRIRNSSNRIAVALIVTVAWTLPTHYSSAVPHFLAWTKQQGCLTCTQTVLVSSSRVRCLGSLVADGWHSLSEQQKLTYMRKFPWHVVAARERHGVVCLPHAVFHAGTEIMRAYPLLLSRQGRSESWRQGRRTNIKLNPVPVIEGPPSYIIYLKEKKIFTRKKNLVRIHGCKTVSDSYEETAPWNCEQVFSPNALLKTWKSAFFLSLFFFVTLTRLVYFKTLFNACLTSGWGSRSSTCLSIVLYDYTVLLHPPR